jgi:unsaturated chondroitin disaccharide hydrolase
MSALLILFIMLAIGIVIAALFLLRPLWSPSWSLNPIPNITDTIKETTDTPSVLIQPTSTITTSSPVLHPTASPSPPRPPPPPPNDDLKNRVSATLSSRSKADTEHKFPFVSQGVDWEYTDSSKWTSGFFPALALITDVNDKASIESLLQVLETEKTNDKSHDVGFKVFLPFRLAMDKIPENKDKYKDIVFTAAATLATLYNAKIGMTRSWTNNTYGEFPVIVDNLMNLELLLWAGQNKPEPEWMDMANSHLARTIKDFVQPDTDGCVYHRISYKPDGTIEERSGIPQGFSDKSSVWTRGLAWTVYGFTMAYRYTKKQEYLNFAEKVLKCYMANVGSDNVPIFDYKATGTAASIKDSSAAAIIASALAELHTFVPTRKYKDKANTIVSSLRNNYWSASGPFLLIHVCDHFQNDRTDVSAIYADYYFAEAVKRLETL